MKPIIQVDRISKRYRIGRRVASYRTLRETLSQAVCAPFRFSLRQGQAGDDEMWALREISFEVMPGEVLGFVGRNGAGKSTLLKVLSRIVEPTAGTAALYGRVGSLLEVGTGFHLELTGRENIYLNGAILGMKRKEIQRKFDQIVAFAEVERFLDTPVKRYSSGMYMRLAFAVAAHLEPEILIVDEVLAVGDVVFQKKCLGKMGEVAQEGRTVLFVSHNMAAVQHLCRRIIFLQEGRIQADGRPTEVITQYLGSLSEAPATADLASVRRDPGLVPVLQGLSFYDARGRPVSSLPVGSALTAHLHYHFPGPVGDPSFGLTFETTTGVTVFQVNTLLQKGPLTDLPPRGVIACHFPRLLLVPGVYFVSPFCHSAGGKVDCVPRGRQLQVVENDVYGTGRLPQGQVLILVDAEWRVLSAEERKEAEEWRVAG